MFFIDNALIFVLSIKTHLKKQNKLFIVFCVFLFVYSTKIYFTCPYMQYNIMRSSAEYNCIYY